MPSRPPPVPAATRAGSVAGGVLVVTAVPAEAAAVQAGLPAADPVAVHPVGVGPAAAAAGTALLLAGRPAPRLVALLGLGGGFAPAAPVGALVVASRLVAADLGAQTPDGFRSLAELGLGPSAYDVPPDLVRWAGQRLAGTGRPVVCGPVLTVTTVTGTAARAADLAERWPGAVAEGMEGFGVAEAARRAGVPTLEVRAVSNPVGPRDRAAWRVDEALAGLRAAAAALFGPGAPAWP